MKGSYERDVDDLFFSSLILKCTWISPSLPLVLCNVLSPIQLALVSFVTFFFFFASWFLNPAVPDINAVPHEFLTCFSPLFPHSTPILGWGK
jgi:hypothetical protein